MIYGRRRVGKSELIKKFIQEHDYFYERYIENDFETAYEPKRFESICKQFLIIKNHQGTMPQPFELIGKYYYDLPKERRNGEFDIVTKDVRGYVFYEAKFRDAPITAAMIEQEIKQVNDTGMFCYQYGFFAKSGYEENSRPDVITSKRCLPPLQVVSTLLMNRWRAYLPPR